MKHYLRFEAWIRRAPTVAVITGVVIVLMGWGMGLLTRFSIVKANAAAQPLVGDEGAMPDLDGAIPTSRLGTCALAPSSETGPFSKPVFQWVLNARKSGAGRFFLLLKMVRVH